MAPIPYTDDYHARLRNLVEPIEVLEKQGFTVQPVTDEELLLKRRCSGCNKTLAQLSRKSRPSRLPGASNTKAKAIVDHEATSTETAEQKPKFRCRYHAGKLIDRRWTCCLQAPSSEPCSGAQEHIPRPQSLHDLNKLYQFHITPPAPPSPPKPSTIRFAVALDCEMGQASSGDSELIRLTLIDYFTGVVLIDNIVEPDVPMQHLNTRYSGVSWADVKAARRKGTCLKGKDGARRKIWKYVGRDTIVVGHGVSNDLRALRWIHDVVVDSLMLEQKRLKAIEKEESEKEQRLEGDKSKQIALGSKGTVLSEDGLDEKKPKTPQQRKPGLLSLKTLAKQHLQRDIQTKGKEGHDSLEDAIAARDLVHRNIVSL